MKRLARYRDFRLLFAGQTVSLIGDNLAPIALAFVVVYKASRMINFARLTFTFRGFSFPDSHFDLRASISATLRSVNSS